MSPGPGRDTEEWSASGPPSRCARRQLPPGWPDPRRLGRRAVSLWIRVNGTLPDDPLLHTAAFTYASDMTLLGATLVPHDLYIGSPGMQAASLDHTIWFHRPFRADEWWLYDQVTPSAIGGRGLAIARVFSRDGRLVASVAQEGLIRVHRAPNSRTNRRCFRPTRRDMGYFCPLMLPE